MSSLFFIFTILSQITATGTNSLKYGRPDHQYLKYRWQPNGCNIPRFDGLDLLKRLKGKKVMFVGDSISYNHWGSMVRLLHNAVKGSNITSRTDNSTSTVKFQDYDVSIIVFNSHYLVDIENEQVDRVLKLNSLKNGDVWKEIDVLIFNTWLWWYRRGDKQTWDYIEVEGKIVKDMDRMVAFREGLKNWANWSWQTGSTRTWILRETKFSIRECLHPITMGWTGMNQE